MVRRDRPPRRIAGGCDRLRAAELTVPAAGSVLLPVTLTVAADKRRRVGLRAADARRAYAAHPVMGARRAAALRRRDARVLHLGVTSGTTRGQPDRVDRYRYPAYTGALGLPTRWRGGESLYTFHLAKRAINVGVTVEPLDGSGVRPFLMRGLDENRIVGDSGLPIDVGPSLTDEPVPSAGLYWAPPGDYAVAIDSAERHGGAYRLRFWINDVTPPVLGHLRTSPNGRRSRSRSRTRLGRRSALPRVRARRAGRVDRSQLPAALERAHRHRDDPRRPPARRPLRPRPARGRLRGVARRARNRHQPAARAHARDRPDLGRPRLGRRRARPRRGLLRRPPPGRRRTARKTGVHRGLTATPGRPRC